MTFSATGPFTLDRSVDTEHHWLRGGIGRGKASPPNAKRRRRVRSNLDSIEISAEGVGFEPTRSESPYGISSAAH